MSSAPSPPGDVAVITEVVDKGLSSPPPPDNSTANLKFGTSVAAHNGYAMVGASPPSAPGKY